MKKNKVYCEICKHYKKHFLGIYEEEWCALGITSEEIDLTVMQKKNKNNDCKDFEEKP